MINNAYKIEMIEERLNLIRLHIAALQEDIKNNPTSDDPRKPSRQSVLNDFLLISEALNLEKNSLTNDIIE
jgi:hypothetical protein